MASKKKKKLMPEKAHMAIRLTPFPTMVFNNARPRTPEEEEKSRQIFALFEPGELCFDTGQSDLVEPEMYVTFCNPEKLSKIQEIMKG